VKTPDHIKQGTSSHNDKTYRKSAAGEKHSLLRENNFFTIPPLSRHFILEHEHSIGTGNKGRTQGWEGEKNRRQIALMMPFREYKTANGARRLQQTSSNRVYRE